jgi:hypothetical protein
MRLPISALLATAVLACGSTPKPAPDEPAPPTASLLDCAKVASHVAGTLSTDRPLPGATTEAVQNMVNTRCTADKWSDETKRCLFAIKAIREGRDCAPTMTDEQRVAMRTAARALRAEASGPTDAEDPSGDWIRHVVEEPAPPAKPPTSATPPTK